jgi:hypothetical protein
MYFTHFDTTHFFYKYYLIFTYFTRFDTTHFFYKYYYGLYQKCVKYVKIKWFCIEKVRVEALKGKIFNFKENNENHSVPECLQCVFLVEFVLLNL